MIVHVVAPFWLPPMPLLSSSLIISCIRQRIFHAGYWQISPAERARVGRMWSGGRGWFRLRAMLGHGRGPASWSTLTADNNVRCLLRIGVRPARQVGGLKPTNVIEPLGILPPPEGDYAIESFCLSVSWSTLAVDNNVGCLLRSTDRSPPRLSVRQRVRNEKRVCMVQFLRESSFWGNNFGRYECLTVTIRVKLAA